MLIKGPDDKSKDLATLELLRGRTGASAATRERIEQEIRNIRSGITGESEAAYEMEFHYGDSKNRMILHDLRLECAGRVAQIDHLLINRVLEIYVCESKHFSEGIAINEHGEFSAFWGGKAHGIPSPVEQNRRHIAVLEAVFKSGQVELPKRAGFPMTPSFSSLILVSKRARITRPKVKVGGLDAIIKNDQLKTRIDKDIEEMSPMKLAKMIGQDTLETFARSLAAAHKPMHTDWASRFALPVEPSSSALGATSRGNARGKSSGNLASAKPNNNCNSCGARVTKAVMNYCSLHKARFGEKVLCIACQGNVPQ